MLPKLKKRYRGRYVAIHKGEVVGIGKDKVSVAKDVYEKYGYVGDEKVLGLPHRGWLDEATLFNRGPRVNGIVDSSADITVITPKISNKLELLPANSVKVAGFL